MPTYTVTAVNVALSDSQKEEIAAAVTKAHHESTGAPGFFAQVIFPVIDGNNHFIGGRRNSAPHVFIHGLIRAGRSTETKQSLIRQALADVQAITGVGPEDIWMYIQDLDAPQMVEFGRFLPEPGGEAQWRNAVTSRKLADFARDGIVT